MVSNVLKTSNKQTWETPQWLFDRVNSIYNFTLDCCAEHETAKVDNYFTKEDDCLTKDWSGVVWCNPPYNREQGLFIRKAMDEYHLGNVSSVVCLIPSRTDTKIWHDVIFKYASQIIFIKGRLRFGDATENAPFPSALFIFGEVKGDLQLGKQINLK